MELNSCDLTLPLTVSSTRRRWKQSRFVIAVRYVLSLNFIRARTLLVELVIPRVTTVLPTGWTKQWSNKGILCNYMLFHDSENMNYVVWFSATILVCVKWWYLLWWKKKVRKDETAIWISLSLQSLPVARPPMEMLATYCLTEACFNFRSRQYCSFFSTTIFFKSRLIY